jgi:hypothetical protein
MQPRLKLAGFCSNAATFSCTLPAFLPFWQNLPFSSGWNEMCRTQPLPINQNRIFAPLLKIKGFDGLTV